MKSCLSVITNQSQKQQENPQKPSGKFRVCAAVLAKQGGTVLLAGKGGI